MREAWRAIKPYWKFATLLLLSVSTFSYAMFQGGFVSWFLFDSFIVFALYALALMLYPLNEFELERSLPKQDFTAGETLTVKLTIRRKSRFPLAYLIIEDHLASTMNTLEKRQAKRMIFPWFKREYSFQYQIDKLPRGEHHFDSYLLKTGDLLGLVEKEKNFSSENRIVVYPAYSEFFYRPLENAFDQGSAVSRQRVQRDTSMAVGVRDYQPGDRFSWINWKASAKRNEMMTKEFEQRQSTDVYLVMDCATDPHFEATVSFTASLVASILKKGAQTGFLTVSKERVAFPIRGGELQLQSLLYHLAKIQQHPVPSLDQILQGERQFQQQALSLMLITAQLTRPLIEKSSLLNRQAGAVTIFLVKEEGERPTQEEIALKSLGDVRRVRVLFIDKRNEAETFSEVNIR